MVKYLADRFQEFHFGSMLWQKFNFLTVVANLIIVSSLKYDFNPVIFLVIGIPFLVFLIWLTGRILEVSGFRKAFYDATWKNVRINNENNIG